MTTENPYQKLVDAASDHSFTKMMQAAQLTGAAQAEVFAEAQRLNKIAEKLNQPSLKWRQGRLTEAVSDLEQIVRSETVRQSDIFGRLKTELIRLGGDPGEAIVIPPHQDPVKKNENTNKDVQHDGTASIPSSQINPKKRETSLDLLHPAIRKKVEDLITDLAANSVPMKIYESFRTPERQAYLYAQGRTRDLDKGIVTKAKAWQSYHQYGVAIDMVIDHPNHAMWDTGSAKTRGWWDNYHELARKHGLEPLSFEKPHVQLIGVRTSQLLSGEEPGPGDDSWFDNFADAIARWPGSTKPPLPSGGERPAISDMANADQHAVAGIDWSALPAVKPVDWMSKFSGREWRVDADGVYLRHDPFNPQRTPGTPTTVLTALDLYADHIGAACQKFDIPPELVLMTIATETAQMRKYDFTGPKTFRWESHVTLTTTGDPALDGSEKGDYSAGPMQVLSNTARDINNKLNLGFSNNSDLKWFKNKPNASSQDILGLYKGNIAIPLGTGYLHMQRGKTNLNPVLVSAAYNAGSVRTSGTNSWHIRSHGDHIDRAIKWFGDACEAFKDFGR
ncbi:MAG: D-alanyl-D-alanine carboxypeptidase family protein [Rhodobacteraceae bacterium]|nr:D-alanyl-D-alanine carboxypeptidase family protein [Paracoccaceae bacterium]